MLVCTWGLGLWGDELMDSVGFLRFLSDVDLQLGPLGTLSVSVQSLAVLQYCTLQKVWGCALESTCRVVWGKGGN